LRTDKENGAETVRTLQESLKDVPMNVRAEMALKEAVADAIAEH
jgi:hypothetical protein